MNNISKHLVTGNTQDVEKTEAKYMDSLQSMGDDQYIENHISPYCICSDIEKHLDRAMTAQGEIP